MNVNTSVRTYLIRSTATIFVGLFINQTLVTISGMILTAIVPTQTLFGQINVMQQIIGISGLFLNVGLNTALTFFVARHGRRAVQWAYAPAIIGSFSFALIVIIVLSLLSTPIARIYHLPGLAPALVIGSLLLVMNSTINVGIAVFSGMRRFTAQGILMVLTTMLSVGGTIGGVVLSLHHGDALDLISLGMVSTGILACFIVLIIVHRFYPAPIFVRPRIKTLRRMLHYGVPTWAGNIAKSFQQSYLVVITGAASVISAGYLSNALKIVGFANIITWAFNVVALPFLSQAINSPMEARRRATLCFRYNNFILFPLTLLIYLFPRSILLFLFGSHYVTSESIQYVQLTGVGVLFSSVSRLGGTLLNGIGRTRANFWTMIISGIILLLIAPFVVSHHPVLATWTYVGGWGLSAISIFWFLIRDGLPLDWMSAFIQPLGPTVLMTLLLVIARYIPEIQIPLFILAIGSLVVSTWLIEKYG